MAAVLTPPAPEHELDEICELLGSTGAAARFLGRERAQIARWRKGGIDLREDSIELIDGAWNATVLILNLVGPDRVGTAVHQRWPLLEGRTPADYVREGRPNALLEALRGAATGVGVDADADVETVVDDEIADWFVAALTAPAVAVAVAEEDDDEDDEWAAPRIRSNAWRGGGTMSSDRWFKS